MSAIAGILYLDGRPAQASRLDGMLEAMAHRGPSHAETWADGPMALGCRLLRTTPESSDERLPLCDEARGTVITADARIDNRAALIAELGPAGAMPVHRVALIRLRAHWYCGGHAHRTSPARPL